ncbi:hypothetical protein [Nitrosomonas sp. Is37]|uniref:hypothetical protein n=1 Tax=Nitrosomonas sp. Is37 TaxID=3080535 RepID=UPI00294AFAEF|nr:hypothetical protein [Nitrosomonas sp. Is37]MDV6343166.1 hypothetical protein [Nitrosomonas sp. Is37]
MQRRKSPPQGWSRPRLKREQSADAYSISKSKMTRRRAADSINNTARRADKIRFDLEMELDPELMKDFGNYLPTTFQFDEGQEIIIVGAGRVLLHIDTHDGSGRRGRRDRWGVGFHDAVK